MCHGWKSDSFDRRFNYRPPIHYIFYEVVSLGHGQKQKASSTLRSIAGLETPVEPTTILSSFIKTIYSIKLSISSRYKEDGASDKTYKTNISYNNRRAFDLLWFVVRFNRVCTVCRVYLFISVFICWIFTNLRNVTWVLHILLVEDVFSSKFCWDLYAMHCKYKYTCALYALMLQSVRNDKTRLHADTFGSASKTVILRDS